MTFIVANGMSASTNTMNEASRKAHDTATDLRTMLSRLMDELLPLATAWRGAASGSFSNVRQRYEDDSAKLHAALESLATALGQSNTTYVTTDSDAEATITKTGAQAGSITSALQIT